MNKLNSPRNPLNKYVWMTAGVVVLATVFVLYATWNKWKSASQTSAQSAMREHELFIHESRAMTQAQRSVSLRNEAQKLTTALESASDQEKIDIQSRLVGIYGSLGDIDSAIAINKQFLENPNITPSAQRIFGVNYTELLLTKSVNGDEATGLTQEYINAKSRYTKQLIDTNPVKSLALLQMESRLLTSSKKYIEVVSLMDQLDEIYQTKNKDFILPARSEQYALLAQGVASDPSGAGQISFWKKIDERWETQSIDRVNIASSLFRNGALKSDALIDELVTLNIDKVDSPDSPILAEILSGNTLIPKEDFPKARKLLGAIVARNEEVTAKNGSIFNKSYVQSCYSRLLYVLERLNDTPQMIAVSQRYLALFPNADDRKAVEGRLYEVTR